jgi:hypothetical protein
MKMNARLQEYAWAVRHADANQASQPQKVLRPARRAIVLDFIERFGYDAFDRHRDTINRIFTSVEEHVRAGKTEEQVNVMDTDGR